MQQHYDIVVIGGGFFGCEIAIFLAQFFDRVAVFEAEDDILLRASLNNQARLHQGYHYPRSILTAARSRANYRRFAGDYPGAIVEQTRACYAVPHRNSHVTAGQFEAFMRRIGAPIEEADEATAALFDPDMIEAVFAVEEASFCADTLREIVRERLQAAGVELYLRTPVQSVQSGESGNILTVGAQGAQITLTTKHVFNATYAGINGVLGRSGMNPIPLEQQWTEMVTVDLPPELQKLSITVMCGPFFSLMPFPPRGCHVLSHVRYTPHCQWEERAPESIIPHETLRPTQSRGMFMLRDAQRYVPLLSQATLRDDPVWEVKTLLPRSRADSGRPILFYAHPDGDGVYSVLGGKIDNIYDIVDEISAELGLSPGRG